MTAVLMSICDWCFDLPIAESLLSKFSSQKTFWSSLKASQPSSPAEPPLIENLHSAWLLPERAGERHWANQAKQSREAGEMKQPHLEKIVERKTLLYHITATTSTITTKKAATSVITATMQAYRTWHGYIIDHQCVWRRWLDPLILAL